MEYLDDMGIKTITALNEWFDKALNNSVEFECVKTSKEVIIFWSVGNKLHKHSIMASVIYVIQRSQILETVKLIKKSLEI